VTVTTETTMTHEQEDRDYEISARYDYRQETFGSYCQLHRVHYGADCPVCEDAIAEVQWAQDVTEPGEARVSRTARREVMLTLRQNGWTVVCRGTTVAWTRR
jgi:hypothetical protein